MPTETETRPVSDAAKPAAPLPMTFGRAGNLYGVDDATRAALIADAHCATAWGVHRGVLILSTARGTTLVEPREVQGQRLLFFDHMPRSAKHRNVFWVPVDDPAVSGLGTALRARPECRRPFHDILGEANG